MLAVVAVVLLGYRMGEVTVLATLKKYPKKIEVQFSRRDKG